MLKQTLRGQYKSGRSKEKTPNHEWVVEVPDLVEEMDLVFAREQCRANAVYGRISPSLLKETTHVIPGPASSLGPVASHLIIKSTLLVQKLDKLRVRLAPPEIEVPDLKVAPN